MNIGFVFDIYPTISTFILNQAKGMMELGHQVYLFPKHRGEKANGPDLYKALDGKVVYPEKMEVKRLRKYLKAIRIILKYGLRDFWLVFASLNVFRYGRRAINLSILFQISPYLGKNLDIIQVHYGDMAEDPVLLKQLGARYKLFTMFHGYDIRKGLEQGGKIYEEVFRNSNAILSICKYNTGHLLDFGCPESKIIPHPVGIDLDFFRCARRKSTSKQQKIEILSVGRLVWEKGYVYALEAMQHLKQRQISFSYSIIGEGYLQEELIKLVREKGLAEQVHFLGQLDSEEIKAHMCKADIFLQSSEAEALPISIMEAAGCMLPTVATDVGSIDEEIVNGITGWLVPTQNSRAIAERISYLIEHRESWVSMGQAAREHMEKHFEIHKLNKRLESLYINQI